jgi:GH24 family phage-related lysozyme (muramidase)
LKSYQDRVGVWTIGYGTTSHDKSITGKTITKGMTISKETAEKWLRASLREKYEPKVSKYDSIYPKCKIIVGKAKKEEEP